MTKMALAGALGVLALAGVAARAQDTSQQQRVNLRGGETSLTECAGHWTFWTESDLGISGNGQPFTIPAGQRFVLTDAEWTAQSVNPDEPQQLIVDSFLFPPTHFRSPVLNAPANAVIGSNAYGQTHLQTGVQIAAGICATVSSGKPEHIYLHGFLEPAGSGG